MGTFLSRVWNAGSPQGTTAFERVFLAQQPWSSEESIRVIAELCNGSPDFDIDEVRLNVKLALREHPRLSEVISDNGLWTKVDVDASDHVVALPAESAKVCTARIAEEPPGLRAALSNMAAFQATGRPLWQVIVTPRKLLIDIHHGLVDGVGLAVIAASIFQGQTLAEANALCCAASKAKALQHGSRWAKFFLTCKALCHMLWYFTCPLVGALMPEAKSPVFAQGQPKQKKTRLFHLGPYELQSLKEAAKGRGKLNSILIHAISQGVHAYCYAEDNARGALPTRIAVPVSFKQPCPKDPQRLRANNDFCTLAVPVPPPSALPMGPMGDISLAEAMAAKFAQSILSFLPLPLIRHLYQMSSRIFSFALSNVDASWADSQFLVHGRPSTEVARKIRIYGYGAAPADISLFILANSHGKDLHVGVTAGCQIRDPEALTQAIDDKIRDVMLRSCNLHAPILSSPATTTCSSGASTASGESSADLK